MNSHSKQEIAELKKQLQVISHSYEVKVTATSDNITTCVLIDAIVNCQRIKQIGVSIKGPNDKASNRLGFDIAYGRALKKMAIRILNDKSKWGIE